MTTNFSDWLYVLITHDFWISGERQKDIRLNVWDQLSQKNNASPKDRTSDPWITNGDVSFIITIYNDIWITQFDYNRQLKLSKEYRKQIKENKILLFSRCEMKWICKFNLRTIKSFHFNARMIILWHYIKTWAVALWLQSLPFNVWILLAMYPTVLLQHRLVNIIWELFIYM